MVKGSIPQRDINTFNMYASNNTASKSDIKIDVKGEVDKSAIMIRF